ncbi:hypothetical protein HYW54_02415 [Candidatus Gottesmanbacteria bacterium]|nr:hypothetical protein [Candidatus Gottesmanbacteria bacterium]
MDPNSKVSSVRRVMDTVSPSGLEGGGSPIPTNLTFKPGGGGVGSDGVALKGPPREFSQTQEGLAQAMGTVTMQNKKEIRPGAIGGRPVVEVREYGDSENMAIREVLANMTGLCYDQEGRREDLNAIEVFATDVLERASDVPAGVKITSRNFDDVVPTFDLNKLDTSVYRDLSKLLSIRQHMLEAMAGLSETQREAMRNKIGQIVDNLTKGQPGTEARLIREMHENRYIGATEIPNERWYFISSIINAVKTRVSNPYAEARNKVDKVIGQTFENSKYKWDFQNVDAASLRAFLPGLAAGKTDRLRHELVNVYLARRIVDRELLGGWGPRDPDVGLDQEDVMRAKDKLLKDHLDRWAGAAGDPRRRIEFELAAGELALRDNSKDFKRAETAYLTETGMDSKLVGKFNALANSRTIESTGTESTAKDAQMASEMKRVDDVKNKAEDLAKKLANAVQLRKNLEDQIKAAENMAATAGTDEQRNAQWRRVEELRQKREQYINAVSSADLEVAEARRAAKDTQEKFEQKFGTVPTGPEGEQYNFILRIMGDYVKEGDLGSLNGMVASMKSVPLPTNAARIADHLQTILGVDNPAFKLAFGDDNRYFKVFLAEAMGIEGIDIDGLRGTVAAGAIPVDLDRKLNQALMEQVQYAYKSDFHLLQQVAFKTWSGLMVQALRAQNNPEQMRFDQVAASTLKTGRIQEVVAAREQRAERMTSSLVDERLQELGYFKGLNTITKEFNLANGQHLVLVTNYDANTRGDYVNQVYAVEGGQLRLMGSLEREMNRVVGIIEPTTTEELRPLQTDIYRRLAADFIGEEIENNWRMGGSPNQFNYDMDGFGVVMVRREADGNFTIISGPEIMNWKAFVGKYEGQVTRPNALYTIRLMETNAETLNNLRLETAEITQTGTDTIHWRTTNHARFVPADYREIDLDLRTGEVRFMTRGLKKAPGFGVSPVNIKGKTYYIPGVVQREALQVEQSIPMNDVRPEMGTLGLVYPAGIAGTPKEEQLDDFWTQVGLMALNSSDSLPQLANRFPRINIRPDPSTAAYEFAISDAGELIVWKDNQKFRARDVLNDDFKQGKLAGNNLNTLYQSLGYYFALAIRQTS